MTPTPIHPDPDRLAEFEALTLLEGSHANHEAGMCAMEAAAWLADEEHSDHPACVSPVVGAFMRRWNDDLDDAGRQRLKPYVLKSLGSRTTPEDDQKRSWMATDWLVRVHTPAWLDLAELHDQANALRALPEIGPGTVADCQATIGLAQKKAAAAWDAAWDAARAAAWDAARAAAWAAARAAAWAAARAAAGDAARDAARAAAWDAARAAAWDAAWAAAWDAAWAAAGAKLEPTKLNLQASAFDLLDRMLAVGREER